MSLWDHLPVAALTAPRPYTQEQQDHDDQDEPRLHAYPDGSSVSLCGKLKAAGDSATADRFCKQCEALASSVLHRG